MEVYKIRVPIDHPGLKRKLDVQWMKGILVGKLDERDGHVWCSLHMEPPLDNQCEDWRENFGLSQIWWERF